MARVASSRFSCVVASRPSMPGKLDIHEDEVGALVASQRESCLRVRGHRARSDLPIAAGTPRASCWWGCLRRPGSSPCQATTRRPDVTRRTSAAKPSAPRSTFVTIAMTRPFEPRAVVGADVLGGDDEDRDTVPCRVAVERLHHVEAVHLRHHQIEHDRDRAARAARGRWPRRPPCARGRCRRGPGRGRRSSSTAFGSSSTDENLEALRPRASGKSPSSTSDP